MDEELTKLAEKFVRWLGPTFEGVVTVPHVYKVLYDRLNEFQHELLHLRYSGFECVSCGGPVKEAHYGFVRCLICGLTTVEIKRLPVHACGDPNCIVPHPAPHKKPPEFSK